MLHGVRMKRHVATRACGWTGSERRLWGRVVADVGPLPGGTAPRDRDVARGDQLLCGPGDQHAIAMAVGTEKRRLAPRPQDGRRDVERRQRHGAHEVNRQPCREPLALGRRGVQLVREECRDGASVKKVWTPWSPAVFGRLEPRDVDSLEQRRRHLWNLNLQEPLESPTGLHVARSGRIARAQRIAANLGAVTSLPGLRIGSPGREARWVSFWET